MDNPFFLTKKQNYEFMRNFVHSFKNPEGQLFHKKRVNNIEYGRF